MANVPPTPFVNYDIKIEPLSPWAIPPDRVKRLIRHLIAIATRVMNKYGKHRRHYHEQCEVGRNAVQEEIAKFLTDQKGQMNLSVKLTVIGVFGNKPNLHEVEVIYKIV